jgi:urocanate hydratase
MSLTEPLWQNPSAQVSSRVYVRYLALAEQRAMDGEKGLAGTFVFCGLLDAYGRESVMAANIAGAASLVLSGDAQVQRQAIRDGVLDFAVNSLDEGLRILKNEIRKQQAVSVGVDGDVQANLTEMLERGVQPVLLASSALTAEIYANVHRELERRGAAPVKAGVRHESEMLWWSVQEASALWLPKLDQLAASILPESDRLRRRWLRLSARNLPRRNREVRFLTVTEREAADFAEAVEQAVQAGTISVRVNLFLMSAKKSRALHFAPAES